MTVGPIPASTFKKPFVLVIAGSVYHFWEWARVREAEIGPMIMRSNTQARFATAEKTYQCIIRPEQAWGHDLDTEVILTMQYDRFDWIGDVRARYHNTRLDMVGL